MSDNFIALIGTIAIIALIFACAPFLNRICPPCARSLQPRRLRKAANKKAEKAVNTRLLSARSIDLRLELDS
jgi:hypothetical protein